MTDFLYYYSAHNMSINRSPLFRVERSTRQVEQFSHYSYVFNPVKNQILKQDTFDQIEKGIYRKLKYGPWSSFEDAFLQLSQEKVPEHYVSDFKAGLMRNV